MDYGRYYRHGARARNFIYFDITPVNLVKLKNGRWGWGCGGTVKKVDRQVCAYPWRSVQKLDSCLFKVLGIKDLVDLKGCNRVGRQGLGLGGVGVCSRHLGEAASFVRDDQRAGTSLKVERDESKISRGKE